MRELLKNLGYLVMVLDHQTNILHLEWNEKSDDISIEEYKNSAYEFRDLVLKRPEIKWVLNNLQRFEFIITPDLQFFIANEIMNPLFKNGLEKMALVMPEDVFAYILTEQVGEGIVQVNEAGEKIQSFDSIEKAEAWLLIN